MIQAPLAVSGTVTRGRQPLGQILIRHGFVTEAQLQDAIDYQLQHTCPVGEGLIKLGYCTDVEIAQALAEQIEAPFVDLRRTPPPAELLSIFPREIAMEHGVLPISRERGRLLVVALNASDIRVDEALRQCTGLSVLVGVAPESHLREHLHRCYGVGRIQQVQDLFTETQVVTDLEIIEEENIPIEKLIAAGEEVSAVQIVSTLVSDAVRKRASDIHIEPQDNEVRVRYRIDGEMISMVTFDRRVLQSVVARTKVICVMDLAENRKPQDGGCRVRVDGQTVELRGSTLPGVSGEIVVLRILRRDAKLQDIESLGFSWDMQEQFRKLLAAQNGLVLVTGPTGSGKTTTLYAALNYLNRDAVNIITVEDPVEVRIASINQVQVDEKAGRTFASTLRSMLRQDPDILMVGEIRDTETVEIACRAALTGHLVLSTLHTRSAFGTLARLNDMGVSRHTTAASVNGILAQRLLRRICEDCAEPYPLPAGVKEFLEGRFGSTAGVMFRHGRGCHSCRKTGYSGRVAVYELLALDDELRRLISEGAEREELYKYACEHGYRNLEEDAFRKACQGLVAPEEVLKLCAWVAPTSVDEG